MEKYQFWLLIKSTNNFVLSNGIGQLGSHIELLGRGLWRDGSGITKIMKILINVSVNYTHIHTNIMNSFVPLVKESILFNYTFLFKVIDTRYKVICPRYKDMGLVVPKLDFGYKIIGLLVLPSFGMELDNFKVHMGDYGVEWDYMRAKSQKMIKNSHWLASKNTYMLWKW